MDWNEIGQTAIRGAVLFGVIWFLAKAATEAVASKIAEHKAAEKDAMIRQLECDNWHLQQHRSDLIWVRQDLTWEKARRKTAEERADSLYNELIKTYGRIRTAPTGSVNEGGAPAQVAA
jgi:hypothetical protein